jgi:mono/diheme cytochrome c family protein
MEPARGSNAADGFNSKFVARGEAMFAASGENLQALNCAGCHGPEGVGGVAPATITGPDGRPQVVDWQAPALNTVLLRYSREEVTFIITYGRPFSPMPAWGLAGGGALNDQQVQNLVDYLESIQLTPEEAQAQAEEALAEAMELEDEDGDPLYESEGEALFNLGLTDGFAGGAYACGRCHTPGWSYFDASTDEQGVYSLDGLDSGCGAFGPSLCGGVTERQFPENEDPAEGESPFQDQIDFVSEGSTRGVVYGEQGQGTGRMPGFGVRPAEPPLYWLNNGAARDPGPGMLTLDMIEAIVEYERSL